MVYLLKMVIFHGKLLVITRWYSGYFQRNLRVLFSRDFPRRIEVEAVAFMADLLFGKAGQKKTWKKNQVNGSTSTRNLNLRLWLKQSRSSSSLHSTHSFHSRSLEAPGRFAELMGCHPNWKKTIMVATLDPGGHSEIHSKVISCYIMLYHFQMERPVILSYHIISYYIISYHIISYHINYVVLYYH